MNKFILTIDEGNTKTDCALFDQNSNLLKRFPVDELTPTLTKLNISHKGLRGVISSVKKDIGVFPFEVKNIATLLIENKFIDMPVHYNQTIGADRLASSYGLFCSRNFDSLVIDSGTFTTVDKIDATGFMGGYILPGLNLLAQTYLKGEKLNHPNSFEISSFLQLPQTTKDAINEGTLLSFIAPIKEIIQTQKPNKIFVTGGNGEFLYKTILKLNICQDASIQFETNLVHLGLLEIAKKVYL